MKAGAIPGAGRFRDAPTSGGRGDASPAADARRGAFWAFANNGSRQIIGFVAFLGLARLLSPEDFGVVALGTVLVLLGNLLMEQGLGEALVQAKRACQRDLESVFWACLLMGFALLGIAWWSAGWIADVLDQPRLAELLPVLAVQYPLNALALVPQSILQRQMDFKSLAVRGSVGLAFGCALAIVCASQGWGAWSLVAQQVGGSACGAVILWRLTPWRPRCRVSLPRLGRLHRFGRNLVGTGLLDLFNRKFDDFLIGAVLGTVALGLYAVAYQALLIIEQTVSKGFDALALSALSRLQQQRAALASALQVAVRYAAVLAVPIFALTALFAEPLITLAFGSQWAGAAEVLAILALVGALQTVFQFNHALFKAVGQPAISMRLGAISAVVNVVGFCIAVRWGIEAVAWAYAIRGYIMAPLVLHHVQRLTGIAPRDYLRNLLPALAGGAGLCAVVLTARIMWPDASGWQGIVSTSVVAFSAHLAIVEWLAPDLRRGLRGRRVEFAHAEAAIGGAS